MAVTLELCAEVVATAATPEDIARALGRRPRGEDWFLTLTRANDDFMDVVLEENGALLVRCEENGKRYRSASVVDEATLEELLLSFLRDDGAWHDQAAWVTPPASPSRKLPLGIPLAGWVGIGIAILVFLLVVIRRREWIVVLFALAFPGMVVLAIVTKLREVRRAATWKQGSARITRSDLVTALRNGKEVRLPAIEYEFSIGFNRFHGNRVSIGEIMGDSPQVEEALTRYRTGTSVPVYYDPLDPRESVLERDLPRHFAWIWVLVAVLFAGSLAFAYWFVR